MIETDENQRLDKYLAAKLEWMTRTQIKALIEDGFILVNGRIVKASYPVKRGDLVEVTVPDPEDSWLEPENIPLDVYYEDSDLLVINKPAGMVVHPAAGNRSGTLVNALLHHCKDLSGIGGIHRPGIVHRLDKGTSGLLVACKNDFAHRSLSKSFARRQVTRKYHAVVHGLIPHNSTAHRSSHRQESPGQKLMAVMEGGTRRLISACLSVFPNTVIWNSPETGRTHQIRVHMQYIGHPVVGDPQYGRKRPGAAGAPARAGARVQSSPDGKYLEWSAPLPDYFETHLNQLRKKDSI